MILDWIQLCDTTENRVGRIFAKKTVFGILDVGCGTFKRGTLGIDTDKRSHADIIAHAEYLPFKDCSFNVVLSSNVIEHLDNPEQAIAEHYRVAKKKVVAYLPWRDVFIFRKKGFGGHKWSFTRKWFQKLAQKYNFAMHLRYSDQFIIPLEIKVVILKR